jgi:hypothetical protein
MKSQVDPAYWRRFNALPLHLQEMVRKSHRVWLNDPFHPSLHFKKLKGNIWSVRIGDHYRTTGYFLESDTFVWLWIGTHEEYNKL